MARDRWVMWWAVLMYLVLLGAVAGVFMAFTLETHAYPVVSMYLTIGVLMYVCDPRYWVHGFYHDQGPRHETRMLIAWPFYYPYYVLLLLWIGYSRYRIGEE